MPRYLIERHFGPIALDDLDEPGWVERRKDAFERFPEIVWEYSHAIQTDEGLVTYCVYVAPSADYCRGHAQAADVPADRVTELVQIAPGPPGGDSLVKGPHDL